MISSPTPLLRLVILIKVSASSHNVMIVRHNMQGMQTHALILYESRNARLSETYCTYRKVISEQHV